MTEAISDIPQLPDDDLFQEPKGGFLYPTLGESKNFMEISDNVRANRDFWVELLLDEGWAVKKGMIGVIYATDLLGKLPSISIRRLAAEREKETSCWSFQSMRMSLSTGSKNRILLIFYRGYLPWGSGTSS